MALASGGRVTVHVHLAAGMLRQIARPPGPRRYGMCGLLAGYDPATAVISP